MQRFALSLVSTAALALTSTTLLAQGVPAAPAAPAAPAPAPQQEAKPAGVIDAAAKKTYDAAVAAVRKLKGVSFVSEMKLDAKSPELAAMIPPDFGGKARFSVQFGAEGKSGLGHDTIRAEILKGEQNGMIFVLAPEAAIAISPTEKEYMEGGGELSMMLAGMAMQSFPSWLSEQRGEVQGPAKLSDPVSIEPVGDEKVDGVDCAVVKAVRTMEVEMAEGMPATKITITETTAFAKSDNLPRRIRLDPDFGEAAAGMGPVPSPIYTITEIKADPEFAADLFSTKAPEGYKKTEPEVPGMGGEAPEMNFTAGDAAPDFKLKDADGKEVTMASFKDKVVLLDFWATWCGPCKAAMPVMQKLHDEFKDKGVVVLGVNMGERSPTAGKEYIASKKFTYPCVFEADELANAYGITAIPTLVVVGKDGKIMEIEVGMSDPSGDKLRAVIEKALGGK
jgi:thiol-disulfide isomerase/thioredoxin